jgi:hypothetical protein
MTDNVAKIQNIIFKKHTEQKKILETNFDKWRTSEHAYDRECGEKEYSNALAKMTILSELSDDIKRELGK